MLFLFFFCCIQSNHVVNIREWGLMRENSVLNATVHTLHDGLESVMNC